MRLMTTLALCAGICVFAGCGEEEAKKDKKDAGTPKAAAKTMAGKTEAGDKKETEAKSAKAVNAMCPMMGEAVTDDGGRVEWEGKTVGFCCEGCIEGWNKLSDEQKKTKLAGAMKAKEDSAATETEEKAVVVANTMCPIMNKPVKEGGGKSEWKGKTIGFCCPGCIKKWESLTDADKETKLAAAN